MQEKEKKEKNVRDLSSEVRCKRFGTRNKSRAPRVFWRQETARSSSAIPTRSAGALSLIRYSFSTIQNKLLCSCLARILVWVKEEYFLRRRVIIYFLIWLKLAIIKHPIIFAPKLGCFFFSSFFLTALAGMHSDKVRRRSMGAFSLFSICNLLRA